MTRAEHSLRLFLNGFTARDIAEPLTSFDVAEGAKAIHTAMDRQQVEVAGIHESGILTGWLSRVDLDGASEAPRSRGFDSAVVMSGGASLNEVVENLKADSCIFLRNATEVDSVVQISEMEKPPMRMWLFGLVTITELRVTRMIDEVCPGGSWQQYLSPARLQMAVALQEKRRARRQEASLLACLQLADKGKIVARNELLRQQTRFSSRREVDSFVNMLQDLRNDLAHSHDISGDWEVIRDLARNVHRIILGPPGERELSSESSEPSG